jgi:tetratricopeptide (TPR) repeat protein
MIAPKGGGMQRRWIATLACFLAALVPATGFGKGFAERPPGEAAEALARAERALTADDAEAARRDLERVIELAPDYAPVYGLYKNTFNRTPDGRRAAADRFRKLAETNPDRAAYWYALGRLSTDIVEREKAFDTAMKLAPDSAWSYAGIGLLAELKNDSKTAAASYEKAHAMAPGEAEITASLVQMLVTSDVGRRADAVKLLDELIKTAPASYWTEDAFAAVADTMSGEEAVAAAKRYVELFPQGRYTVWQLNVQLEELAKTDKAAATKRALEMMATIPGARYASGRGRMFEQFVLAPAAAESQAAVDRLAATTLASKEDSPQVFLALAGFYDREAADHAVALALDTRAFDLAKKTNAAADVADQARLLLGRTHLWRGETKQAVADLEPIAFPRLVPSASAALGDAHMKLGDAAKAVDAYVRAVAVEPTPARAELLAAAAKAANRTDADVRAAVWTIREKTARPAADFTLQALGGGDVSLASLRGKVVLLNFWFPG